MMIENSRTWHRLSREIRAIIERYQQSVPVDLRGLARELGVPIKAATLPPGISGEIRPSDNGYVVRVSRHDSNGRQRFTVAHELAHFILHRPLIGQGITDDALYRSNQSDSVEAEANRLAADILMPAYQVEERAALARKLGVENLKESLAETFEVSPAAMSIRLGD